MKVALVHDWLTGMRGGERCLEAFLKIYPTADIFTLVHIPGSTTAEIDARVKGTSFLTKIPGISRLYRIFLPLYPVAISQIDLDGYDLIVSLSHAAAKNVRTPSGATHVCYCFTPMRYVWDQVRHYFGPLARVLLFPILESLRRWDRLGADNVDYFVTISHFVAARVRLFYGKRSHVIAPPVRQNFELSLSFTDKERGVLAALPTRFFLCAGALVPYKRIEIAVEAFNTLGYPLVIAGKGPELHKLKSRAAANIFFVDKVSDTLLWEFYKRCKALIFPGIEDFGIVPVECLAAGRPVVGVNAGGLRDSMSKIRKSSNSPLVALTATGVLISKKAYGSAGALVHAVQEFLDSEEMFSEKSAKEQAAQFSHQRFFDAWGKFCDQIGIDKGIIPTSVLGEQKVENAVGGSSC
jgi:glycosyltransferase involved in cell wall biosynthesis